MMHHKLRSVIPASGTSGSQQRASHISHATPSSNNAKKKNPKMPESGFFADADPKAEIYPVRRGIGTDITKRGGRWQSDFIWNSNWQEQLDFEDDVRKQVEQGKKEAAQRGTRSGYADEEEKGFLSLTSKVDLNSMDVDLSDKLKPRKKPQTSATSSTAQQQRNGAKTAAATVSAGYPVLPPTRLETRQWDRSGKFSKKVVAIAPNTPEAEKELADKVAAEIAEYDRLKQELQTWATMLTAVCLGATYAFYGRDVAASYGVGALAGLIYLRLLNNSVDGVGGGLGAAIGSNRLLIPVILALGYNRYNTLVAEDVGLQLQLLPMLVGFFTYKGAVVARQGLTLFGEMTESLRAGGKTSQNQEVEEDGSAASVDRVFKN